MDKLKTVSVSFYFVCLLFIAGCNTTNTGIPAVCGLAPGDEVTDMQIDNANPTDLNEGEVAAISVTVTLNRPATAGGVVCMELKDSELVRGDPMAIGILVVSEGDQTATGTNVFGVQCFNDEIRGQNNALVGAFIAGTVNLQASTGERSTRVRAQELGGIQRFAGAQVGVAGERSQRIRVRCS